jgi:predicted DNA-binding transcriptional regulator AlpA
VQIATTPEIRKPAPAEPPSKTPALAYPQENLEARPSGTHTPLLDVRQAATILGVSESWVRRHVSELPTVRVGRLVRFDRPSLLRRFQVKSDSGNRMKQKGEDLMFQVAMKTRYQSGRVYKKGKVVKKWYGQFREDQIDAEGKLFRVQKNVRLGTLGELPTKHSNAGACAEDGNRDANKGRYDFQRPCFSLAGGGRANTAKRHSNILPKDALMSRSTLVRGARSKEHFAV